MVRRIFSYNLGMFQFETMNQDNITSILIR